MALIGWPALLIHLNARSAIRPGAGLLFAHPAAINSNSISPGPREASPFLGIL